MPSVRLVCHGSKLRSQTCQSRKPITSYALCHKQQKSTASPAPDAEPARRLTKRTYVERARASLLEREFFESVLGASATKRDAKGFLNRFNNKSEKTSQQNKLLEQPKPVVNAAVNLGNLYQPNKAVENSPIFSVSPQEHSTKTDALIRIVIVKLREPQTLDEDTLTGIATTLAQLGKLGVRCVLVLDISPQHISKQGFNRLQAIKQQSERVVDLLHHLNTEGARLIDQSITIHDTPDSHDFTFPASVDLELSLQDLLLYPLRKGMIPVIPSVGQTLDSNTKVINANQLITTLTRTLANPTSTTSIGVSVDRIIFLDPLGGIPDPSTHFVARVFVNLAQEYDEISRRLLPTRHGSTPCWSKDQQHLENLECIQNCLAILPPSASALLTTPEEVSRSARHSTDKASPTGVRTRPTRNTLIHNILTDKPLVSSSLPRARLQGARQSNAQQPTSTFFKLGVPVSIVPEPSQVQWIDPGMDGTTLTLDKDSRIDLAKLVHLIDDSFGRPLDVEKYLQRIDGHIAGIIIAGDYEGGAILTWETLHGRPDRPAVPYLDKFAVLRRCQGSGGVADIVFNAMVKRCFPGGVVWRSRQSNPVNKWYFERANGTWKIPESNWTMFWTGNEVDFGNRSLDEAAVQARWEDYVAVCSNIQPTWADQKPPD